MEFNFISSNFFIKLGNIQRTKLSYEYLTKHCYIQANSINENDILLRLTQPFAERHNSTSSA